jgi:hypothetical protein
MTFTLTHAHSLRYMEALLEISGTAMVANQEEEPNVVLQGIEFWSTVCDIEDRLIEQLKDMGAPDLMQAQAQLLAEKVRVCMCYVGLARACVCVCLCVCARACVHACVCWARACVRVEGL